nr:HypC/HybG/HupF family hydrogenase formation chaperone [Corynebacterium uropygiale]
MCLGVPGKVLRCQPAGGPLGMAEVDVEGEHRSVCTAYTPEVGVGDWVLISHGFIMDVLSEEDAQEVLRTMKEHRVLRPELLPQGKERLQDVSRRSRSDHER